MILTPIVNRLTAECPSISKLSAAYSIASAEAAQTPVVYIYPALEEARRSDTDNFVTQSIECQFALMIGVDNTTIDTLDSVRDEIRAAMLGYVISADYDAIEFLRGEMLDNSASVVWWRDTYMTVRYVRQS